MASYDVASNMWQAVPQGRPGVGRRRHPAQVAAQPRQQVPARHRAAGPAAAAAAAAATAAAVSAAASALAAAARALRGSPEPSSRSATG